MASQNQVIRDDLLAALMALGWSRAELAHRLEVHRNTVSAWATGKAEMPGPARKYLDLAVKVSRLLK